MPGHTCNRCAGFVAGIEASGALSQNSRASFLCSCSRHKARSEAWHNSDTPAEFWDLSFQDSLEAR